MSPRWVALLRGVNVGGGNKLPMADLRATIEAIGWSRPVTYIQSGNVGFDAPATPGAPPTTEATLAATLTAALRDRHGLSVPVVVRDGPSLCALAATLTDHEIDPKFRYVAFLDRAPASAAGVDPDGWLPDRWALDGRELHLTYPHGSGRSKLTIEVFERAWKVTATARNLNTVRALAALAAQ